jgi:hypothetical protein
MHSVKNVFGEKHSVKYAFGEMCFGETYVNQFFQLPTINKKKKIQNNCLFSAKNLRFQTFNKYMEFEFFRFFFKLVFAKNDRKQLTAMFRTFASAGIVTCHNRSTTLLMQLTTLTSDFLLVSILYSQ